MHNRNHYKINRTLADINKRLCINNAVAKDLVKRVTSQCMACASAASVPKPLPRCPIISERFGERVGMDLKKLGTRGYMLTVVDHFTTFCWLGFLRKKEKEGVVQYLCETVFPDIKRIIGGWGSNGPKKITEQIKHDIIIMLQDSAEIETDMSEGAPEDQTPLPEPWGGTFEGNEFEREDGKQGILQSDRGGEFNNDMLRKLAAAAGFVCVMGSAYSPETKGKTEVKNKHAANTFMALILHEGGLKNASFEAIERCLRSTSSIENMAKGSKSGFAPYVAATHHEGELVKGIGGEHTIDSRGKLSSLHVFAMNHVMAGRQANRGIAMIAKYESAAKSKTVVKVGASVNFNHPSTSKVTKNSRHVGKVKEIVRRKNSQEPSHYVVESRIGKSAKTFTVKANKVLPHAALEPEVQGLLRYWRKEGSLIDAAIISTKKRSAVDFAGGVGTSKAGGGGEKRRRNGDAPTPRLTTKATNASVPPEFAVAENNDSGKDPVVGRPILAQVIRGTSTIGATITLEYFGLESNASMDREVYRRSGDRDVIASTDTLHLLDPCDVEVLDDAVQRVVLREGLKLDGIFTPQDLLPEGVELPRLAAKRTCTGLSSIRPVGVTSSARLAPGTSLRPNRGRVYGKRPDSRPSEVVGSTMLPTSQNHEPVIPMRRSLRNRMGRTSFATRTIAPVASTEFRSEVVRATTTSKTKVGRTKVKQGKDQALPRNREDEVAEESNTTHTVTAQRFDAVSGEGIVIEKNNYRNLMRSYKESEVNFADRSSIEYVHLRPVVVIKYVCGSNRKKELPTNFDNSGFFTATCANLISLKGFGGLHGEDLPEHANLVDDLLVHLIQHVDGTQPAGTEVLNQHTRSALMDGMHSGGPMETMAFDAEESKEGCPKEVIEAMTSHKTNDRHDDLKVLMARRKLGVNESYRIIGGCPIHTGKDVSEELTSKFAWPQSFEVGTDPTCVGIKSVQDCLTELATSTTERECIFCVKDGVVCPPKCEVALDWDGGRREMFFVYVEQGLTEEDYSFSSSGVEHSPVVEMFGDKYILCGVIYRTTENGKGHFLTQTYMDGCWWIYDDCKEGGALHHVHQFDPEYCMGLENTLMYVRVDMVEKALDTQVVERPPSYGTKDESEEDSGASDGEADVCKVVPGIGPPPLLHSKAVFERKLQSGLWPLSAEIYNEWIPKECCGRRRRVRIVSNDSGNCFATSLLLTTMAVSKQTIAKWPAADAVTPRARPFFSLIEAFNELNHCSYIEAGEQSELEAAVAKAVNTALSGGNSGVDYAGVGMEYGDPGSLLTCFTKSDYANGATKVLRSLPFVCMVVAEFEEEVRVTREAFGVDQGWVVTNGCNLHYGQTLEPPLTYDTRACRTPVVTSLPRRTTAFTVEQGVDEATLAWERGLYSFSSQTGRCPHCKTTAPWVRITRSLGGAVPNHIFLTVERAPPFVIGMETMYAPTPSPSISAHGATFRLVAVIHKVVDQDHFFCQALYEDCWIVFDDLISDFAQHQHEYNVNPEHPGESEPYLFAYVRELDGDNISEELKFARDDAQTKAIGGKACYSAKRRHPTDTPADRRKASAIFGVDTTERYSTDGENPWDINRSLDLTNVSRVLGGKLFTENYANMGASGCAEDRSDMKELALAMSAFWIDIVFKGSYIDVNESQATLDNALKMGFPETTFLETLKLAPSVRWTHEGKTNLRKLLIGEPIGGLGPFKLWSKGSP